MNTMAATAPSRRSFLRQTLCTVTAGGVLLAGGNALRADTHVPFEVQLLGNGWDANRKQIIVQSLGYINYRFLDTKIMANGLAVDGSNFNVHGNLWNITNLGAYKPGSGHADILWYQLAAIRVTTQRPKLKIMLEHEPAFPAVGWAFTNVVQVKFTPNNVTIEGDFLITLNSHFLGGAGHYSDPRYWAGTIAHEMLHNLGHLHIKDRDAEQYSRCQLIAHERALYYNGSYRRGLERPMVLCGGRGPGGG